MSFFGLGKSYLYPKYYWDFRTNEPIGALSGAAVPQATFSGSAPAAAAAAVDPAGETITYSIGAAGAAAAAGADGGLGGSTTMILLGTAMTGSGGGGGFCTVQSLGIGGTATGGMTNTDGGTGRDAQVTLDDAAQGGGGIGLAPMGAIGYNGLGGDGAQSVDIEGLQAAVVAAGYSWTGRDRGVSSPETHKMTVPLLQDLAVVVEAETGTRPLEVQDFWAAAVVEQLPRVPEMCPASPEEPDHL